MKLDRNQTSQLRNLAHKLKPVVIIGNNGLTENVLNEVIEQLEHHELIKVRVNAEERDARKAMIDEVCLQGNALLVQRIGHIAVFYKPAKEPTIKLVT